MAWNLPTYDTDNYSFGPCIIFIGSVGTTPVTDIGAVQGNTEITVSKEVLEIKQGSPQVVTKQYVIVQAVRVSFTSLEALGKLATLKYALGAGVSSGSHGVGTESLGYGGDINLSEVALMVQHQMPNGTTLEFCFWRAQGKADTTMAFSETDPNAVAMEFEALDGQTDFGGAAISSGSCQRLFKLIKTNAPEGWGGCDEE